MMQIRQVTQPRLRFAGLLMLLVLAAACARQTALVHPPDSFTILHLTDTHLCQLDGYHPTLVEKRRHYGNGRDPLKRALTAQTKKIDADAIVVTGDLIDFYEGTTAKGELRAGQVEGFASLAGRARVPLWLALGNHDISTHAVNEQAVSRVSQSRSQVARAAWIRRVRCFGEGTYYYRDVQVGAASWRLYFLDNAYRATGDAAGGHWDRAQLDWLEKELGQLSGQNVLLFFHIPLPVGDTNGDGASFPKLPEGWPFPDTYEKGICKILNEHPSVVAAFVGHNHKNIIEDIPFPRGHRIVQVETGAFASNPANWRTITLTENTIAISKPGDLAVETTVEPRTVARGK